MQENSQKVISGCGYLPLFEELNFLQLTEEKIIIAIEGGSASGKSTLAGTLQKLYGCAVFHIDDFFLQPHQRTKERLEEVGGNFDRERFEKEVLIPLSKKESVLYIKYDCKTKELLPAEEIVPTKITVIEGAYCMHPSLRKYYTISVFLDISEDTQKKRIHKRNSEELQKRFFEEWIPMENRYFKEFDIKNSCDIIVKV
ncbi:MAG: uridine kinase [Ruminococcaceae bacterium]|nr:uridine kinase [Oscillospiraceae bacterium]